MCIPVERSTAQGWACLDQSSRAGAEDQENTIWALTCPAETNHIKEKNLETSLAPHSDRHREETSYLTETSG